MSSNFSSPPLNAFRRKPVITAILPGAASVLLKSVLYTYDVFVFQGEVFEYLHNVRKQILSIYMQIYVDTAS